MPLYMCNAVRGVISDAAKQKIAADLTDIHCEITGAPRTFVHVFFFEDAPHLPVNGQSVFLFGSIRAGRSEVQKQDLTNRMQAAVAKHCGLSLQEVVAATSDVPANWVMEGGEVLPEPGEEATWLAAHRSV